MSEDGDGTCQVCTLEMDLTDQQLKACPCGFEICVWCWNTIMNMAENDKGLCPACRAPYNKEKILAKAANCGRRRVPKIPSTGLQQRSGDVSPPPRDGSSACATSNKTIPNSAKSVNSHNAASHVRDPKSASHAGKSTTVLPAAATRARDVNTRPPVGTVSRAQTSNKQKGKSLDSSSGRSSAKASRQVCRASGPLKCGVMRDCRTAVSIVASEIVDFEACASNKPEERPVVQMSGAQHAEPATAMSTLLSIPYWFINMIRKQVYLFLEALKTRFSRR